MRAFDEYLRLEVPAKVRYGISSVWIAGSIVALAVTARTVAIPRDVLELSGAVALVAALAQRIRDRNLSLLVLVGAVTLGMEFSFRRYPTAIRDTTAVVAQSCALISLPALVVTLALGYFAPISKPQKQPTNADSADR